MKRAFGMGSIMGGLSGLFVVSGIGFVVAGFLIGGEALIPMVATGVSLLFVAVVFVLVGRYVRGLDPTELLATGVAGTALIISVRDTGVTVNELNAVFELELDVTLPGAPTYRATTKVTVGRVSFGTVQPGMVVAVKVDASDHSRVAVDWAGTQPVGAGGRVAATADDRLIDVSGMDEPVRITGRSKGSDIVAAGTPTTGTIVAVAATGRTADEFGTEMLDSVVEFDDPIVMMELDVSGPDGVFRTKGLYRVPDGKSHHLVLGATVPVAYLPDDPEGSAAIAWDRF